MYIKIIILSLFITCCKSNIFGISKPDTLLRRLVPIMMDANREFKNSLNQYLLDVQVQMPLMMLDDPFVATTVTVEGDPIKVEDFKFTLMRNCKIIHVDADILTMKIKVTVFCICILGEGQYKPCETSNTKKALTLFLNRVAITVNVDLEMKEGKLSLKQPYASVTYTKGVLRPKCVWGNTNEIPITDEFKKFIDDKIGFYFTKKIEDMLVCHIRSIEIMKYFSGDPNAIALFKTSNPGLSTFINSYIDKNFRSIIEKQCQNGRFPVPNLCLTFSKRFFLLTYSGKIQLLNGYIGDFLTLEKFGDLALFGNAADNRYIGFVKFHMKEAFAYFEHMNTNIWGWTLVHLSGVQGSINSMTLEIGVDISLNMMGRIAKVNEVALVIPEMGRITTQVKSLGLILGTLASLMQSLITDTFHCIFVSLFEREIQNFLNIYLVGTELSFG